MRKRPFFSYPVDQPGHRIMKIMATICCVIGVLLAAGCTHPENGITLSVGGAPAELDFWQSLVEQFEAQTNIRVDFLRQPTDTDQRRQGLVVALEAGKSDPDVFLMDVVWISQFAASGWLAPLDEYAAEDRLNLDAYFSNILNLADRYHKQLIALPVYVDAGLLYYRSDLLDDLGVSHPPTTWQQLVAYASRAQNTMIKAQPGFHGFVWQGAQYEGLICNFLEFAGSNGGGIFLQNGKILLNHRANLEALRFMRDLIHQYRLSPPSTYTEMREEQVRETFQQGNALFERNWPYAWPLHQQVDSKVRGVTAIAPLPHFPGGQSVSTLGGWHVGISRFSDQKGLAWKLVAFLISYDTQKQMALKLGWNPGRRDLYRDPEVLRNMPHLKRLEEVFQNARPRPTVPYYTQLSAVLQRYLNAALAGKLEPQAALEAAQKEAQRIVQRYHTN